MYKCHLLALIEELAHRKVRVSTVFFFSDNLDFFVLEEATIPR